MKLFMHQEIVRIYKETLTKDLNLTSSCLVHYPCTANNVLIMPNGESISQYDMIASQPIATLLTGDASYDEEVIKLLNDILRDKSQSILQVPHHGAESNNKLIDYLNSFENFIISYGLGNKYHHPQKNTVYKILIEQKNRLFLATEAASFRYAILTC